MIAGLLEILQVRYAYTDPIRRQRAQSLMYMIWVLAVFVLGFVIYTVSPILTNASQRQPVSNYVTLGVAPIILYVIYRLIESGKVERGAILFVSFLTAGVIVASIFATGVFNGFLLIIPLIAAGTLFNRLGLLVVFAFLLTALLGRAIVLANNSAIIRIIPSIDGALEIVLIAVVLITGAVFLVGFSGSSQRLAQLSLRDLRHWQEFSKLRAGQSLDAEQLALRAVDILQNQLSYNLAQIYFADESGFVTRRVRLGTVDRQFTIKLDDLPTIGEAVREKRTRAFRRDVSAIQDYPLAPSRIGIAAPIVYQGIVLGLIDAQSRHPDNPTLSTIAAFNAFAETLADFMMNSRRVIELQKTVDDQEQVIAVFRTRLTELQSRGAQVVSSSWIRYLEGRGAGALGYDVELPEGKAVARAASDLPPRIRETLQRGELFIETTNNGAREIHVPILLREEVIGAMALTIPAERPLTERQIETLRTVSSRLGQSLENNRLFEQSQAQAARERKASEVSARLIGATNVENLLEVAASSFNEALGAVYTRVFLESDAGAGIAPDESTSSGGAHKNGANGANGSHKRS